MKGTKSLRCSWGFHSKIQVLKPTSQATRTIKDKGISARERLDKSTNTICSRCQMQCVPASVSVTGREMWLPAKPRATAR